MSTDFPEIRIGQIYKNQRNKPTTVFLVHEIHEKHVPNFPDKSYLRVMGVLTSGENCLQRDRSLHEDSLRKMFPYLLFNPPEVLDDDGTPQ